jgi:hypothetical protein
LRRLLAVLLVPARTLAQRLAEVSDIARRTEEARIYHWHRTCNRFPPPRARPDS